VAVIALCIVVALAAAVYAAHAQLDGVHCPLISGRS
jgi:hypothetical protein